jgi:glutamate formiminotransferase
MHEAEPLLPILEAVPNLSAGRDPALVVEASRRAEAAGADVVDASLDPDHDRAVLTLLGAPPQVEDAAVALAVLAAERIDLTRHRGVHPRVGALDVLPLIPLQGLTMEEAVGSARRVARRIATEAGVPCWLYGAASTPPGRGLPELRRGGFEALSGTRPLPPERVPDFLPPGWTSPGVHPTAGGTCIGARPVLLAWNVDVAGVEMEELREMARRLRAAGGGPPGLRVLALELRHQGRRQLSMNLEDALARDPWAVFERVEEAIRQGGGTLVRTEIIGLAPDSLLLAAGAHRLRTLDRTPPPLLSSVLARHRALRLSKLARGVLEAAHASPGPLPEALGQALASLERALSISPQPNPPE